MKTKNIISKILFLFILTTFLVACGETCNHVAGEVVIENVVDGTAEEDGSYDEVVYCTLCNAEISRVHKTSSTHTHVAGDAVEENKVEATCEKDGSYDTVVRCKICKVELSNEHHTITKLGHDIVSHDEKEATCNETGHNAYDTCNRCSYTTYKEIPITGKHTPKDAVEENKVEATCEIDGYYEEVIYCKDCGKN